MTRFSIAYPESSYGSLNYPTNEITKIIFGNLTWAQLTELFIAKFYKTFINLNWKSNLLNQILLQQNILLEFLFYKRGHYLKIQMF